MHEYTVAVAGNSGQQYSVAHNNMGAETVTENDSNTYVVLLFIVCSVRLCMCERARNCVCGICKHGCLCWLRRKKNTYNQHIMADVSAVELRSAFYFIPMCAYAHMLMHVTHMCTTDRLALVRSAAGFWGLVSFGLWVFAWMCGRLISEECFHCDAQFALSTRMDFVPNGQQKCACMNWLSLVHADLFINDCMRICASECHIRYARTTRPFVKELRRFTTIDEPRRYRSSDKMYIPM